MQYVERKSSGRLAKFVECFWLVRDRPRARRQPDRILPDGCPEWIIHLGDVFARRIDESWVDQPRSFLAGTLSRPWLVRAGVRVCTVGIRFRPGAVAALFDADLTGTADSEVSMRKFVEHADTLVAAIRKRRTTQAMLSVAESVFAAMIDTRLDAIPKCGRAVDRIKKHRGRVRVETLAKTLGVSRRTLERTFQKELGVSPKQYARIVRLNAVLASMNEAERGRVVDIALDAGFFDEAHLSRDFRALAGRKLTSRGSDGRLARHFIRPDRLRALLADA